VNVAPASGRWMPTGRTSWIVPVLVLAVGAGLAGGYVRWRRPLLQAQSRIAALGQIARPPTVSALRDARPSAVIDLKRPEGTSLVHGQWQYTETPSHRLGTRGAADLPDTGWSAADAGALDRRRRTAPGRATWYRIDVMIPERIGDFDTKASAVVLEVVVDGYAEVWVNRKLAPVLGQNGSSLIIGSSARSRLVLTRDARPGQRFELTVLGVERLLSEPPADGFSIRSATLDFVAPPRATDPGVGAIVRLDPALDGIVAPGARLERVAGGLRSGEGPVWMPEGYLLFSDFNANLIYRWTADDGLSVFRSKSGYAGFDIAQYVLPGANGLAVDRESRLTIAEHGRRRVVRLERNGDVTVLADGHEGRRLNSPNDLVYKSDGALYFTDPPYGLPRGHADRRRELPYSGVFRWFGGRLELLTADLTGPNGLAFSPDERYLYVTDWEKAALMRYDVHDDGTVANGRIFFKTGADGLKVDQRGNVYAAGGEGVKVISPAGKALGAIRPPESPNNLAWGDDDYRTLYIVGGTGVYRIRLEVSGSGPWRNR
jgi:gluconolactonase